MLDTSLSSREWQPSSAPSLKFRAFLLLASWLDCCLLSLEWIVLYIYFTRHGKSGKRLNHTFAVLVVLVDLLGTVGTCGLAWTYALQSDPSRAYQNRQFFMPLMLMSTNFAAAIEQLLLTFRIYRLSRSKAFAFLVTFVVLGHFSLNTTCAIYLTHHGGNVYKLISTRTLVIGGILSALVDLLTPCIFYWELRRITHSFNESTSRARGLVRKVSAKAFSGGIIVAIIGVLSVILFTTCYVGAFLFFWGSLGRLYGITTLIFLRGFQSAGSNDSSWDSAVSKENHHKSRITQFGSGSDKRKQPSFGTSDLPSHFTEITSSSDGQRNGAPQKGDPFFTRFSELSKTSSIAFSPRRRANTCFSFNSPSTSLGYPPESLTSRSDFSVTSSKLSHPTPSA